MEMIGVDAVVTASLFFFGGEVLLRGLRGTSAPEGAADACAFVS